MCGIAGVVELGPEGQRIAVVASMTAQLTRRGPDGTGSYHDPRATLGHARLSIVDLSDAGNQPMIDGDHVLVFNGEIYNHIELRHELDNTAERQWRSRCDTETLLAGYDRWQDDVVRRLRGMFAFAIWDRAEGRLFAARDPFGKKPFYYWSDGGAFAFASTTDSLVRALDRRPDANLESLSGFLLRGHFRPGESVYRHIRTLPAGHALEFDPATGVARIRPYLVPRFALGDGLFDSAAVQEETGRRLGAAVTRRLMSDVPIGVLLSGGVDSSLVGLSAPSQLTAFCAAFPGTDADESHFAQQVADIGGMHLQRVEVTTPSFPTVLDQIVDAFGEPFGDLSAIPAYSLFAGLKPYVKVALTGDGGDEVFAGYRDAILFWARHRLGILSGSGFGSDLATRLVRHPPGIVRQAGLGLATLSLPGAEVFLALYREGWTETWRKRFFRPEAWKATGESETEHAIAKAFVDAGDTDLDRYLNMNLERLSECFLTKIDRTAMAHSIEARCPMLDINLFDYASSRPVSALLPRGRRKAILKDLLARKMGEKFANRRKVGFSPPLAGWLRAADSAKWIRATLTAGDSYVATLMPAKAVEDLLARHQNGEDHSARIWRMLVLDTWHTRMYGVPRSSVSRATREASCGS